jgi:O-antigen ligase
MTRIRWIGEIAIFALVAIMALYLMAPFHSKAIILFVLIAPLLLFFVFPSAIRAAWTNVTSLVHSFTWWHWLVLLAMLGGLNFRMKEAYDVADIASNPVDASVKIRLLCDALVVLILAVRLVAEKTSWLRPLFRGLFGILIIFVFITLITTLWSVKPYWTFYKSAEYGLDVALIVAIVTSVKSLAEYKLLLNWVYGFCGALIGLAMVEAIFMPRLAFDYGPTGALTMPELTGVFPGQAANGLGTFGAILAIVALCRLISKSEPNSNRGWYQMILGFGLVAMFMTEARSAIGAFLLAVILLLILTRRIVAGMILATASALVLMASGLGKSLFDYMMRGQTALQFQQLTGRMEIWSVAWQKIMDRPIIGWGAYAGGRFVVLPLLKKTAFVDVDSTPVETLLDTGIPGLAALIMVIVVTWYFLLRGYRSNRLEIPERSVVLESLLVLAVLTIRCVFVSNLTRHPGLPFLAIVGLAELVRRRLKEAT